MFDFVVRQARLGPGPLVDIGIRDGLIRAVEQTLPEGPWPVLAAGGQLLIRGYVDPHMHLDKALLAERAANQSGTLSEAIDLARSAKQHANRADIAARAYAAAQMAIRNGVRAIRTHVDIDPVTGLEGFRAVAEVREELKAEVAIQIVAFPQDGFGPDDEVLALMRQALAEGADLVGGIPARDADPLRHIDRLCRLAKESAVPVDMHVDESDDPADFTLPLVIDRVRHYGLQGQCTVGHLCSLAAVPDQQAAETIAQAAACGISVITLPSTNLYLQGRGDRGLIRRGTTRINELLAAGVRVAAGGDNLRDPFNPFGNANPLETAWLLAHVAHMGGARAMEQAFAMVSDDAAGLLGITDWEVKPGTAADFLLLPVQSRAEALVSLAKPSYRVRKGQVC